MENKFIRLIGNAKGKPTIIMEFFENGHQLLYLDSTKPRLQNGELSVEEAEEVIKNAGYNLTKSYKKEISQGMIKQMMDGVYEEEDEK